MIKKCLSFMCMLALFTSCCFVGNASADTDPVYSDGTSTWCDAEITEEDLANWETAYGIYNDVNTRASALIVAKSLGLSRTTDGKLAISGLTVCDSDTTKCGFTYVKLMRQSDSGVWFQALKWNDQYTNGDTASFGKLIDTTHGYYYKAECNHYAYKDRFLFPDEEQNIFNETTKLYY